MFTFNNVLCAHENNLFILMINRNKSYNIIVVVIHVYMCIEYTACTLGHYYSAIYTACHGRINSKSMLIFISADRKGCVYNMCT